MTTVSQAKEGGTMPNLINSKEENAAEAEEMPRFTMEEEAVREPINTGIPTPPHYFYWSRRKHTDQ